MKSKARKIEELIKTLDVIDYYDAPLMAKELLKKKIINQDPDSAAILYFQLLSRLTKGAVGYLPPEIDNLPDNILNAAMHYLHIEFGDSIRHNAIKELGEFDAMILFPNYTVALMGEFPSELNTIVEKLMNIAKSYDDIYIEKATTWVNSHNRWGDQYFYKKNEFPCLRVRALSIESRNIFLKEITDRCSQCDEYIVVSLLDHPISASHIHQEGRQNEA